MPAKVQAECRHLVTPAKVVEAGLPTLHALCGMVEGGEDKVRAAVAVNLMECSRFLNLKNGLTAEHVEFAVDVIMEEYPWMTMGDLNLIIRRIKMGSREVYENFTAAKLLQAVKAYDLERDEAVAAARSRENGRHRAAMRGVARLPYRIVDGRIVMDGEYLDAQRGESDDERKSRIEERKEKNRRYMEALAKEKTNQ